MRAAVFLARQRRRMYFSCFCKKNRFFSRRIGAHGVLFLYAQESAVRAHLFRASARRAYVLFLSARKKKYEKERLGGLLIFGDFVSLPVRKRIRFDISPRSIAHQTVSAKA